MNERLKELVEIADEFATGEPKYFDTYSAKLVELVVNECALLIDQYQFESNTPNSRRLSRLVREHFLGVE